MLSVYAKTPRLEVELNLESELTLITGNSGTGKTYLCRFLPTCSKVKALKFSKEGYVINFVTTLNDLRALIADGKRHLILMDKLEQWEACERNAVEELIIEDLNKRSDFNYYIIMHRGGSNLYAYALKLYYLHLDSNNKITLRGESFP